jgi:hypothetical protein
MKKFKNHQRPRRKYRFYIVGHKKALKIWWDSPFKIFLDAFQIGKNFNLSTFIPTVHTTYIVLYSIFKIFFLIVFYEFPAPMYSIYGPDLNNYNNE